jgi:hypothetical protein
MSEDVYLYVAKKPGCGCVVAGCVDKPKYAKDTAKDVARWIKDGLEVSRVQGGVALSRCTHKEEQPELSL